MQLWFGGCKTYNSNASHAATSSYELKIQSTLPYILYSHIIMYMCFSSNSSIFDLIAHIINYQYFFSHSQGGKFASFQIYLIA